MNSKAPDCKSKPSNLGVADSQIDWTNEIRNSGSAVPRIESPIVGVLSPQFITTTAEDNPYE